MCCDKTIVLRYTTLLLVCADLRDLTSAVTFLARWWPRSPSPLGQKKSVPTPAAGSGKGRRGVKKKAAAGKAKRTDETEDAADEVPTADEDESLTSRGMEWRMLLASSTEGLVSVGEGRVQLRFHGTHGCGAGDRRVWVP